MVPAVISFIVCVGIPAAGAVYFLWRRDGTFATFVVGVLCFLISQPILRIPLLNLAGQRSSWFMMLPYVNPVLYYLVMGFTAGLFEESARLAGFGIFRRGHTAWMDGLAYGLGHGGCEAAWIFVLQVLPQVRKGQAGTGMLIGAWERIFAVMIQIGLSFLVLYAVKTGRKRYFILAVVLHALVDFLIILGNVLIVEGLVALEGLAAMILIIKFRKKFNLGGIER
ncbi:MAG: YhfC family glutamic-type intramembrane protease [Lachnospiraceae bacterium]|nr:YhfC family glutamic-type intramembrane protease [Lachnospiraceae bacterium]